MIQCKGRYLFTSESVTEGHPDKLADAISDAVLDSLIAQAPNSRVACETLVTTGMAMIAGEITTSAWADLPAIVRETIQSIGYVSSDMGFDYKTCAVLSSIDKQSPDIAQGVDRTKPEDMGAGDQGMMFGFAATRPRPSCPRHLLRPQALPAPVLRAQGGHPRLPAGPTARPRWPWSTWTASARIDNVVVWPSTTRTSLPGPGRAIRKGSCCHPAAELIDKKTGSSSTHRPLLYGGPMAGLRLTGRKIIQDTYGGAGPTAAAFSGRTLQGRPLRRYMARYIAKNIVAAGLAEEVDVRSPTASAWPSRQRAASTMGTGQVCDET
jgi:S-adenosylmethionine synthetase